MSHLTGGGGGRRTTPQGSLCKGFGVRRAWLGDTSSRAVVNLVLLGGGSGCGNRSYCLWQHFEVLRSPGNPVPTNIAPVPKSQDAKPPNASADRAGIRCGVLGLFRLLSLDGRVRQPEFARHWERNLVLDGTNDNSSHNVVKCTWQRGFANAREVSHLKNFASVYVDTSTTNLCTYQQRNMFRLTMSSTYPVPGNLRACRWFTDNRAPSLSAKLCPTRCT